MKDVIDHLEVEIELLPGEKLTLPSSLVDNVGVGRWLITIEPAPQSTASVRHHTAFLAGYAAEDEGLYDDERR